MDTNKLIETWKEEEQKPFSGWDFSYLSGKMFQDKPPWSYRDRAIQLMHRVSSVLDMGTGGGEILLGMKDHWPAKVMATEEYPPNFKLATEKLSPFGVSVFDVPSRDDALMPFADGEFDLVLNRHDAFNSDEVGRVLKPGGTFLTQQVHGLSGADLMAAFDAESQYPFAVPERYVPRLESAGMKITDVRDWSGKTVYTDVGAIVYHLKAVPWTVEGFSVETHLDYLLNLQERLENGESLSFTLRLYLIEARKP